MQRGGEKKMPKLDLTEEKKIDFLHTVNLLQCVWRDERVLDVNVDVREDVEYRDAATY